MSVFGPKLPVKSPILKKYLDMSARFQNMGAAAVIVCLVFNAFTRNRFLLLSMIIFVPGALSLIYGGSCLQSHNLIRAFAQQTSVDPTKEMAEAFLEVILRNSKTSLTRNSIVLVERAIAVCRSEEDLDPELADQLQEAVKTHISKKIF